MVAINGSSSRIYMGARAVLVDGPDHVTASEWATGHMVKNPAYSWILGKFVEADVPNLNKHVISMGGLQMGQPSILYAPMNINHHIHRVVGCFSGAELLYPTVQAGEDVVVNPYIETVGALWRYYYKDEYYMVKAAHDDGKLFYSMECVPRAFSTVGGVDDSKEYPFVGLQSPTYPKELNEKMVPALCVDPHFVGGALVIPPEKPAWSDAEITHMSSFFRDNSEVAERAFESVHNEAPHLDDDTLQWVVSQMLSGPGTDPEISAQIRRNMAASGAAMPDGSYPILTVEDLNKAIEAVGKAKDPAAAKKHIKKRAKDLKTADSLPAGW